MKKLALVLIILSVLFCLIGMATAAEKYAVTKTDNNYTILLDPGMVEDGGFIKSADGNTTYTDMSNNSNLYTSFIDFPTPFSFSFNPGNSTFSILVADTANI
ncbi:hypothetical protein LJC08_00045 [Methanimicrococcus sp. OttesenSCG-928-J09]|nr:hypothetical protein [Methanimicrococcus sp. OttesenSCG-928-J09]